MGFMVVVENPLWSRQVIGATIAVCENVRE